MPRSVPPTSRPTTSPPAISPSSQMRSRSWATSGSICSPIWATPPILPASAGSSGCSATVTKTCGPSCRRCVKPRGNGGGIPPGSSGLPMNSPATSPPRGPPPSTNWRELASMPSPCSLTCCRAKTRHRSGLTSSPGSSSVRSAPTPGNRCSPGWAPTTCSTGPASSRRSLPVSPTTMPP